MSPVWAVGRGANRACPWRRCGGTRRPDWVPGRGTFHLGLALVRWSAPRLRRRAPPSPRGNRNAAHANAVRPAVPRWEELVRGQRTGRMIEGRRPGPGPRTPRPSPSRINLIAGCVLRRPCFFRTNVETDSVALGGRAGPPGPSRSRTGRASLDHLAAGPWQPGQGALQVAEALADARAPLPAEVRRSSGLVPGPCRRARAGSQGEGDRDRDLAGFCPGKRLFEGAFHVVAQSAPRSRPPRPRCCPACRKQGFEKCSGRQEEASRRPPKPGWAAHAAALLERGVPKRS